MKLLLDSHALVWWASGNRRLGRRARDAIAESETTVSLASCWELGSKQAGNRLEVEGDLFDLISEHGFRLAPIEVDDVRAATRLPLIHRDPFDRMLVAQAQRRGLVIVTADPDVIAYGGAVLPT